MLKTGKTLYKENDEPKKIVKESLPVDTNSQPAGWDADEPVVKKGPKPPTLGVTATDKKVSP